MDNSELNQEATRLADIHSPHMLAKMLLIEYRERIEQRDELARCQHMYANACATLGGIQGYLGNDIAGIDPGLVKQVIDERDALAAHVDMLRNRLKDISNPVAMLQREAKEAGHRLNGQQAIIMANDAECLKSMAAEALDIPISATSLARRDLLKQAEVLDNLSVKYRPYGLHQEYTAFDIASHLEATAITLRQQANQLENQ